MLTIDYFGREKSRLVLCFIATDESNIKQIVTILTGCIASYGLSISKSIPNLYASLIEIWKATQEKNKILSKDARILFEMDCNTGKVDMQGTALPRNVAKDSLVILKLDPFTKERNIFKFDFHCNTLFFIVAATLILSYCLRLYDVNVTDEEFTGIREKFQKRIEKAQEDRESKIKKVVFKALYDKKTNVLDVSIASK